MKTFNLTGFRRAKPRKCFRRRRRSHDPMLMFNMSIFNSDRSWERIFNLAPRREECLGMNPIFSCSVRSLETWSANT